LMRTASLTRPALAPFASLDWAVADMAANPVETATNPIVNNVFQQNMTCASFQTL
jgi:hypothetical protein